VDLATSTAGDLAAALRRREVSSVELLDAYLARISRLNPTVNAVVTLDEDRARQRALAADTAAAADEWWGPLHGLPMTVKDALDTAGLRTTGGSKDFARRVPTEDAPAVARLKDAGAVIFGKTNLPLWSGDTQTWNELFGATANPWDLERAPGGSSGGAAAAVACGFTSLETGTDIGGSIRNPAHFTGMYGHKPTFGLVPGTGYFDRPNGGASDVDINVVGPIARSVSDLALALDVLAGPASARNRRARTVLPPPRATSLDGYRLAVWIDDATMVVDGEVKAVLRAAVDELSGAGAKVEEARPAIDVDEAQATYFRLVGAATAAAEAGPWLRRSPAVRKVAAARHAWQARNQPPLSAGQRASRHYTEGADGSVRDLVAARASQAKLRHQWARLHERYDAVLCPVAATAALPLEPGVPFNQRTMPVDGRLIPNMDNVLWSTVVGVAYLPSTVVPAGHTASGLPIGMQIVAPYYEDGTGLDIARRVDDVLGAWRVPPLALTAG
jgi:amidase